jgi:tRNA(Arg) A34 adenosine deaminase TadA
MKRAIELAVENVRARRGGPFGAVVARGNDVIATGVNLVTATNDPTAHAEVTAIREACRALATFDLTGCDIYASCEPCPMCLGAIYWARIGRVFFGACSSDAAAAGFDDRRFYDEISASRDRRAVSMINLLHDESLAPFEEWRRQANRVEY